MLRRIRVILEMIKFSHTIFALPFALLAAALASARNGGWRTLDLVGLLACMVFARSAAMGFNRWADRDVDALNPRTANRALPAGLLTANQVLAFAVVCLLGFVASCALFLVSSDNAWPLLLSVPVMAFLLGYSYAKRFTALAHVWLGTALALAPLAAWIAIRGMTELAPPLWLGLAIVGWVSGFDILYSCQDLEVDRQLGLHSVPARFGFAGALRFARLSHLAMMVALAALGWTTPELGTFYWSGLTLVGVLLVVEHWLVRDRELARVNAAFFNVNGIISVALLAVTMADLHAG